MLFWVFKSTIGRILYRSVYFKKQFFVNFHFIPIGIFFLAQNPFFNFELLLKFEKVFQAIFYHADEVSISKF